MNYFQRLLCFALFIVYSSLAMGQAKKPTIMIIPSDVWMFSQGFFIEVDNAGRTKKVPDYRRAFQENFDLGNVISKINGLMQERGFPLKNLETVLKGIEDDEAELLVTSSKGGGEVAESPIDILRRTANADIIIQLTWNLNQVGPKSSITFNMQGLDAYTDKQIATAQGTGDQTMSAEVPVLLEEAVLTHIDNFNGSLQDHFNDLFENGREIAVRIRTFDTWEYDLEEELGGDELSFVIEDWLYENTVEGRFNTSVATESQMYFEQVRIPMVSETGRAIDTRRYIRGLQKFLKAEPFQVESKLVMKGLGEATLILGSK